MNQLGIVVKSPKQGVPMLNPYLGALNRQSLIALKAGDMLGFAPASRARVTLNVDDLDPEEIGKKYGL